LQGVANQVATQPRTLGDGIVQHTPCVGKYIEVLTACCFAGSENLQARKASPQAFIFAAMSDLDSSIAHVS